MGGDLIAWGPKNHVVTGDAHWRHLTSMMDQSPRAWSACLCALRNITDEPIEMPRGGRHVWAKEPATAMRSLTTITAATCCCYSFWRAVRWTLLLRRPLSIVIAIEGAVLCSLCVLMHVQWTHLNCRRTPSARMTTHGRLIEHDQCRRSWLCEHVTRRVVFLSWTDASSDVTYPRGRQSLLRQRSSSVSSVRAVATYVMFCNVPMYLPALRVR